MACSLRHSLPDRESPPVPRAIHRAGGEPNRDSCEAIRDARWHHFRDIERGNLAYRYLCRVNPRSMNCKKTGHSHHASSACTGDGINDLRRLKPGSFAELCVRLARTPTFAGCQVKCPQIGPFRGHFAKRLTLKLRLRPVTWPATFRLAKRPRFIPSTRPAISLTAPSTIRCPGVKSAL